MANNLNLDKNYLWELPNNRVLLTQPWLSNSIISDWSVSFDEATKWKPYFTSNWTKYVVNESAKNNNNKTKKRSWSNNKPATPTYIDPNWVTHTGMTQSEFDNRMAGYDAELTELKNNDIAKQRNRMIGNTTYDQIFKDAVAKFQADPNSFNEKQKQALLDSWIKLWYWQSPSQTQQPTSQQAPVTQSNNIVNATPDAAWAGWRDEWYAASDKDNKIQWGANAIWFYL